MSIIIKIIFLMSINVFSDDAPEIMSDEDLKKKFLTVVKDNEIEKKLEQSSEFNNCIKGNKFDPDQAVRQKHVADAEQCFQKILSGKSAEEIQRLSEQLELPNFGLVSGQNSNEIKEYLGDKLYKAMTGIDRRDKNQKDTFKNRKLVKQKDFIELYYHHISKSVMFEISRFCFENLRLKTGASTDSFTDHWGSYLKGSVSISISLASLDDSGDGGFGIQSSSLKDTKSSYDAIFKGIAGQQKMPTARLGDFYTFCLKTIPQLCDQFKKDKNKPGSKACLVQDRLQKIRTAIANTEKVKANFDSNYVGGTGISPDNIIQVFDPTGDNSYSNLTEITSYDILEGGKTGNDDRANLAADCLKNQTQQDCQKFITIDDSRLNIEFNTELSERLQKQAEIARIEALKGDQVKLEKYLTDKGYLDLASKLKQNPNTDIKTEIGLIFDAKREATLKAIKDKIGKRQMTKDEAKIKTAVEANIKSAAEDELTERARMSQVVLFNNIILGFVDAQNKKTGKTQRYVNSWRREEKSLESDAKGKIDENLFDGFKQTISGSNNSTTGEEVVQVDSLLELVLGGNPNSSGNSKSGSTP